MFIIGSAALLFFEIHILHTEALVQNNLFPVEPLDLPDPRIKTFEFHMHIAYGYTMTLYPDKWPHQGAKKFPPKFLDYNIQSESFIHRDNLNFDARCDKVANVTDEEIRAAYSADRFIFGAGNLRRIITINGHFPGPTLVVNQNSNITVYVHNELFNEACTVHFHGFRQKGTWWMDGVPGVQQCPISPGSTFVYRVYADKPGTFWYHGHFGTESNQGLMGALIVIPDEETWRTKKQNKFVQLPNGVTVAPTAQFVLTFHEQFTITNSITDAYYTTTHYAFKQFDKMNDPSKPCFFPNRTPERGGGSPVHISDILINGQSWHNRTDLVNQPWSIPMQTYTIKSGQSYLFRMVDVGVQVVKKIGIQGHKMHVVATDSEAFKTKSVDRIASSPGERYDFVLIADQKPGTYYIVIETLETLNWFTNDTANQRFFGVARIQYEGVPVQKTKLDDMLTTPANKQCTSTNPCTMLNCPLEKFGPAYNIKCVHLKDLESFDGSVDKDLLQTEYTSNFEEHFVRITSYDGLNGFRFMHPSAPPFFYSHNEKQVMTPCDQEKCLKEDLCTCTSMLRIKTGNVIQLVIHQTDNEDRMYHPFHIHGHHFIVVAQGFPTYDKIHGFFVEQNSDIECSGDREACFESSWKNKNWSNGKIPRLNLSHPILKDTVMVPAGGYVVIRYKADNPGWWFMHCHAILHHTIGMAIAVQEGDNSEMTSPPMGKPQCGYIDPSKKGDIILGDL